MTAATDADFVVVMAGLTAQDEGEEYTRPPIATTAATSPIAWRSTPNRQGAYATPEQAHPAGRRARQADGRRARRRQRHRHALARLGARGGDGLVPGPAGRPGAGQAAVGRGELQRQAAVHLGPSRSTSTTPGTATERRSSTTTSATAGSTTRAATPLFPFGYGLSYTTFEYRKLQLGCSDMSKGAVLPVVVNVANTGTVAGDEIVMVWVSFGANTQRPARQRPAKELKGFARVHLAAGRGEADHDSGPPVGPRLLPGGRRGGDDRQVGRRERGHQDHGWRWLDELPADMTKSVTVTRVLIAVRPRSSSNGALTRNGTHAHTSSDFPDPSRVVHDGACAGQ